MSLSTRIRSWLDRRELKTLDLPVISRWSRESFPDVTFARMESDGYKKNAAVFACVNAHAFAYAQPRLVVENDDGEVQPKHPLQALLDKPNEVMSWQELALYIATYKAIGGNCYLKKIRNASGNVIELYPYHDGKMWPVPGTYDWIAYYEYDPEGDTSIKLPRGYRWLDNGHIAVPPDDVIHLKWPAVDPTRPWAGFAPLMALAYEVDTDLEATRYLYALLKNDATPRTIINVRGAPLSENQFERLRQQYAQRHGGSNRGNVGIIEGDAEISRLALDLQELAFDSLRKVPEARICAAFRVPAPYLGLNVGLEQSTYNNVSEARRAFLEDTIMQLCSLDAGELTADLGIEFDGDVRVVYDFQEVVGLSENQNDIYTRALAAFDKDTITRNEARALLGLPPVEDLKPPSDVEYDPGFGWEFKSSGMLMEEPEPPPLAPAETPPALPGQTVEGEVIPEMPLLEDQQKAAPPPRRTKALPATTIERRIERAMVVYLKAEYQKAAEAVLAGA